MFKKAFFRFKIFGIFISICLMFASTGFSHEDQFFDNYEHGWAERYLENLDESVPIE